VGGLALRVSCPSFEMWYLLDVLSASCEDSNGFLWHEGLNTMQIILLVELINILYIVSSPDKSTRCRIEVSWGRKLDVLLNSESKTSDEFSGSTANNHSCLLHSPSSAQLLSIL
jgi:hypothetical protein